MLERQIAETKAQNTNIDENKAQETKLVTFNLAEAEKTIRESVDAPTDPLLDRDHPMFDESIDYTEVPRPV